MPDGEVELKIKAIDDASANVDRINGKLGGLSQTSGKLGGVMKTGLKVGAMAGAAGIAAGGAAAVKGVMAFAEFEQSIANVGAVSDATETQLKSLTDMAKEQGRTTKFTAKESADAMSFLAMAGFEVEEVMGALPGVLQLAAAGNMDIATTADIASNVLTGYGMTVDQLGHVNDVLAQTFTSTNTSLTQLGEAMKYAAPVASSAGISFEEAAAAIGLMGNAGIQGSMAGTSLRGAITKLLLPTNEAVEVMTNLGMQATDATGNLLPLEDIISQLETSGATTADMMAIFGQRAGPAMAALVGQGSDALVELTKSAEETGGKAQEIADRQLDTLSGSLTLLKSAIDGAFIALGERLAPTIRKVAETITEKIMPAITTFIEGIGTDGAAGSVMTLLNPLGTLIREVLPQVLPLLQEVGASFLNIAKEVGPPLIDVIKAIAAEIGEIVSTVAPAFVGVLDAFSTAIADLATNVIPQLVDALVPIIDRLGNLAQEVLPPLLDTVANLITKFGELANDVLPTLLDGLTPIIDAFLNIAETALPPLIEAITTLINFVIDNEAVFIAAITAIGVAIVVSLGPASVAYGAVIGIALALGELQRLLGFGEDAAVEAAVATDRWSTSIDKARNEVLGTARPLGNMNKNIEELSDQLYRAANPAFVILETEVAKINQRIKDANTVVPDLVAGMEDTGNAAGDGASGLEEVGGAAGGAGDAFAGLSDELANLRQEMQAVASAGLDRLNTLIQAEEAYLAQLAPVLADATEEHDRLKDMLAGVEDQISDATDQMKDWENAVLAGTRAFSDATQAIDEDMNKINLSIARIELGVLEEGLEEGGYASDTLSHKIRMFGKTLGLEMHQGKMDIEDVARVLAAAGGQIDILAAKADVVNLEEKVKLGPAQYELNKYFQDLGGYAEYSFREIIEGADEAALKLAVLIPLQNGLNLSIEQQGNLVAFLTGLQENHEELLARLRDQYTNLGSLAEGIDPAIRAIWEADSGAVISSIEDAFAALDRGQTDAAQTAMDNAMALFDEIKAAIANVYPGAETVLAPFEALLKEVGRTVEIDVGEVGKLLSGDLSTISDDLGGVNRSVGDLEKTTEYRLSNVFGSLENNVAYLLGLIRNYTSTLIDIRADVATIAAGSTLSVAPTPPYGPLGATGGIPGGSTTIIQPVVQAQVVTGDQRQLEELADAVEPIIRQRFG